MRDFVEDMWLECMHGYAANEPLEQHLNVHSELHAKYSEYVYICVIICAHIYECALPGITFSVIAVKNVPILEVFLFNQLLQTE